MNQRLLISLFLLVTSAKSEALALADCIQIALSNKETLKASALDLQRAQQTVKGSYSNILPSLMFSGSSSESSFPTQEGGYNPATGEITLGNISNLTSTSTGISLSQNIYNGGIWWNTIAQSKNSYKIAEQFDRQVKINIIRVVHQTYFNYLKTMQLLDVAHSNLKSSQQQLALTKKRFELGSARKTDLLKAEVRFGQARVDVVNNNSALENAYLNLKNAMGIIGSDQDFTVKDVAAALVPVPDFATGFETIQKLNPSVLAKQRQITNAEFNEKITKGARMPNISANANYSGNAEDLENLSGKWDENWRRNISLSISIPIYTGNTLSTRIQQARLNVQKQESEYLTQLQDLSVQLHGILDRLNNYQEVIPINETVLTSAKEDLKLAQKRYSLGSTTILEVLDAQVSVVSARSSLIRTKYDAFIEQSNLKGLLGTLDSELE
ncbi:MAG: hypothetical protein DSY36_03060 [Candidatus Neomarinimicrobiota bacterium]|nr:MAG: hypothetical protein DSY36_03060 [Candidatus Neomarinimicrobiota bacterium]